MILKLRGDKSRREIVEAGDPRASASRSNSFDAEAVGQDVSSSSSAASSAAASAAEAERAEKRKKMLQAKLALLEQKKEEKLMQLKARMEALKAQKAAKQEKLRVAAEEAEEARKKAAAADAEKAARAAEQAAERTARLKQRREAALREKALRKQKARLEAAEAARVAAETAAAVKAVAAAEAAADAAEAAAVARRRELEEQRRQQEVDAQRERKLADDRRRERLELESFQHNLTACELRLKSADACIAQAHAVIGQMRRSVSAALALRAGCTDDDASLGISWEERLASMLPGMEKLAEEQQVAAKLCLQKRSDFLPGGAAVAAAAMEDNADVRIKRARSPQHAAAITSVLASLGAARTKHARMASLLRSTYEELDQMAGSLASQVARAQECAEALRIESERCRLTRLFFLFHRWRATVQKYKPQLRRNRQRKAFEDALALASNIIAAGRSEGSSAATATGTPSKRRLRPVSAFVGSSRPLTRRGRLRRPVTPLTGSPAVRPGRSDRWSGEDWRPLDLVSAAGPLATSLWAQWEAQEQAWEHGVDLVAQSSVGALPMAHASATDTGVSSSPSSYEASAAASSSSYPRMLTPVLPFSGTCDWKIVVFLDVPLLTGTGKSQSSSTPSLHFAAQVQWAQRWLAAQFSKAQLAPEDPSSIFHRDTATGVQLLSFYRAQALPSPAGDAVEVESEGMHSRKGAVEVADEEDIQSYEFMSDLGKFGSSTPASSHTSYFTSSLSASASLIGASAGTSTSVPLPEAPARPVAMRICCKAVWGANSPRASSSSLSSVIKGAHAVVVLQAGGPDSKDALGERLLGMLRKVPRNAGLPLTVVDIAPITEHVGSTGMGSATSPSSSVSSDSPSYPPSSPNTTTSHSWRDAEPEDPLSSLFARKARDGVVTPNDGRFCGVTYVRVLGCPTSQPPRRIVAMLSREGCLAALRDVALTRMASRHPRYRYANMDRAVRERLIPRPHNPARLVWEWMLSARGISVLQRFNLALAVMSEVFASTTATSNGKGPPTLREMQTWIDRGPAVAPEFRHRRKAQDRNGKSSKYSSSSSSSSSSSGGGGSSSFYSGSSSSASSSAAEENESDSDSEDPKHQRRWRRQYDRDDRDQPPSDWNQPQTLSNLAQALRQLALPEPAAGGNLRGALTATYATAVLRSTPLGVWDDEHSASGADSSESAPANQHHVAEVRRAIGDIEHALRRGDSSGAINVLLQTRFATLARMLPDRVWGPADAEAAGKAWIVRLSNELLAREAQDDWEVHQARNKRPRLLEDDTGGTLNAADMVASAMRSRAQKRARDELAAQSWRMPQQGEQQDMATLQLQQQNLLPNQQGPQPPPQPPPPPPLPHSQPGETGSNQPPLKRGRLDPATQAFLDSVEQENLDFERMLKAQVSLGKEPLF